MASFLTRVTMTLPLRPPGQAVIPTLHFGGCLPLNPETKTIPVVTYRCKNCGRLESYARGAT